jgi:hypothetical protein
MIRLLCFALAVLASPFKSKLRLQAENAVLRHQLNVLRRRLHGRVRLTNHDRWFFSQLYRWFPAILQVPTIIRPETLMRWHRAGFRCYWRWKSRRRGGRPQIDTELRALIRLMSMENPFWGAPRIHGELLKLGFEVAQSSVAKWSSDAGRQARDGAPFCVIMLKILPPWTCSLSRPLASRVMNRYVGNLPPMPGVFPDYPAPVVRNADSEREMVLMRWGMPPPPKSPWPPVTTARITLVATCA